VILSFGADKFTRRDLASVECYSFSAAKNLSLILNSELKVPNLKYVYFHIHPVQLALPRLGSFSLSVLDAAFRARGLGLEGDGTPLENWWRHHNLKAVTFNTIKDREAKEEAAAARQKRRHNGNVTRFKRAS
jgi:hypothetical protein